MPEALKLSHDTLGWLVPALGLLSLLLLGAVIAQGLQLRRLQSTWRTLLDGAKGENLERLLQDQLRQSVVLESELETVRGRVEGLEGKMKSAKRYVGLVRFDAFQDIGGNQSFSLAIYDEDGNGAIVTSQVGREVCRVYGKQLYQGRSELNLTVEEQKAIELAASGKSRARISS